MADVSSAPEAAVCAESSSDADQAGVESAPTRGHIGRIVAGSLIGGFVAAVVLVVGPLAGAQEHIITGSVLLTFAAAWAMLAVISERWTDQPQRWAFVPAGISSSGVAVASGLVLVAAGNAVVAYGPVSIG